MLGRDTTTWRRSRARRVCCRAVAGGLEPAVRAAIRHHRAVHDTNRPGRRIVGKKALFTTEIERTRRRQRIRFPREPSILFSVFFLSPGSIVLLVAGILLVAGAPRCCDAVVAIGRVARQTAPALVSPRVRSACKAATLGPRPVPAHPVRCHRIATILAQFSARRAQCRSSTTNSRRNTEGK